MKKSLALLLAVLMLVASLTAVLTSCSSGDDDPGANVHLFLSYRIYDFDPTLAIVDDEAAQILSLLYEPLFRLKSDGSVEGALAEDYEIDKSKNQMTITLRETNWSDSSRVTSNDIVFAWQRILEPTFENPAAALLYDIENALYIKQGALPDGTTVTIADLGVEAPDDETLVITFRKTADGKNIDYDAFLRNLTSIALSPVPEDIVSNTTRTDNWAKRIATITTNGPFTLKSVDYNETGEFSLQRNQYFRRDEDSDSSISKYVTPQFLNTVWQTKDFASIEEYETFLTENVILHFSDTEGNKEDSLYYISELPRNLRGSDAYKNNTVVTDLMSTLTCVLNTKSGNPLLTNANIRRALSTVIDREDLAELLVYARPATGYITDGVYEAGNPQKDFRDVKALLPIKADVTEAERLLNLGLSELADKALEIPFADETYPNGSLRLMYSAESLDDMYVAAYIADAWEKLGFKVILDPLFGEDRMLVGDDITVFDSALQMNYNSDWSDVRLDDLTEDELAELTNADLHADAILIDAQMLSTDPFVALAAFSTTMSGNGYDQTDISESGSDKIFSYAPVPHVSGYSNAAYDELIDKAYNETKKSTRSEYLHEAEELLLTDMPVIPLLFNQDYYIIGKKLTEVKTNAYGMPVFTKAYLEGYEKFLKSEEDDD